MSESRLILPPGWHISDQFSEQSVIVSVAAGAGVNAVAQQSVLTKEIPSGAKAYVRQISARIVDQAGFDQIFLSLKRNGAKLLPWDKITGEQFVDEHVVPVDQAFDPGLLEIAASNISGTAESGAAGDAVAIRVIARFSGYLLTQSRMKQ